MSLKIIVLSFNVLAGNFTIVIPRMGGEMMQEDSLPSPHHIADRPHGTQMAMRLVVYFVTAFISR